MDLKTITTSNGNDYCKSYKTVDNAKKELSKIDEELKHIDGRLNYVIAVNDSGRFYLQFVVYHSSTDLSFHWIIERGHCVMVVN